MMQIDKVIRKYRKAANLTQEEMANRLGVTAPAVNKWENGVSFPDITLLAPIARLLGISVDMLLSFEEELSAGEIRQFVEEADRKFETESYDEVFQWAKEKIECYPNCEQFIWQMALILDVRRMTGKVLDSDRYDAFILSCYSRVLESKEEGVRQSAADSMFGYYMRKEEYEKAEKYLDYFSKENPERKRKQAEIYCKTNRLQDAYRTYEELLLAEYQILSMTLHGIYGLAIQEENLPKAHFWVEKQVELARLFEMGAYTENSCRLDLAVREQDTAATLEIAEKLLSDVETIRSFCTSSMYEHMRFQNADTNFWETVRKNLKKNFREDAGFDFLKDNQRWQKLLR